MKNEQLPQNSNILTDLQNEVSAESAPLLQFITRYAGWIAGAVILLLLIMCGMGIWNWYVGNQLKNIQDELARINLQLETSEKPHALEKLAQSAPDNLKLFIYMNLGQLALENNDPALASKAYTQAANFGKNSPLGIAANLGNISALLLQDKNSEALAQLQNLAASNPELGQKTQFQQLLAEAAARAGDKNAAVKAYEELIKLSDSQEADYFKARMESNK